MISMDAFGEEIDPELAALVAEMQAAAVAGGLVRDESPKPGANRANGSKVYATPQASASGMPPARASGPAAVPVRRDWLGKWEADHE